MTPYNIVDLPIDNGLKNEDISAGRNYLILLKAPTGANVTVKLNGITSDEIPLNENFAIECKLVKNIFISCDAVPGEKLVFGQSNSADDFRIITAPTVNQIGEVGEIGKILNFSDALLLALDKIYNPYSDPSIDVLEFSNTSYTTVLNKNLTADKIIITLGASIGVGSGHTNIDAKLDGQKICSIASYFSTGQNLQPTEQYIFENVKGKTLTIGGSTPNTAMKINYVLQEYTKKA